MDEQEPVEQPAEEPETLGVNVSEEAGVDEKIS